MWTCSSHCIYPLYYHLNQEPPATKLVFNIAECLQWATTPPLSNLSGILGLCLFKVSQFLISSCENENKTRITTCLQSVWEKYFEKIVSCLQSQVCVSVTKKSKCLCIELLPGLSRLLCKETLWPGSEHRWLSCSLSISQSRKHRSTAHNPEPDPLLKCNFLSKSQFQPNH